MKRLLLSLVALVVITTGCDAIGGDDVAATVDGTDISVTQVVELANAIVTAQGQESKSTDAVLDGEEGRVSLTQWVQLEALHAEFVQRGESLGPDDKSQAEEQAKQLKGLSTETRNRYTSLLAEAIAIDRSVGQSTTPAPEVPEPTDEEVAAKAAELIATVPPEQLTLTCANAIAGPLTAADQVQALLDGGTDITDPAAFTELQYAPPTSANPLCASPSQLPPELAEPFTSTPVGELARADFAGQTGGSVDSTLFFVPTGPRTLTAEDPDVIAAARQQLEQDAQSVAAESQKATEAETAAAYEKIFRSTEIDVDPRFGTFDASGSIQAPIRPLEPTPAPDASSTGLPDGATATTP